MGAPYIYYGDEAGMWGANDPDCRKPIVWDELQFEDEVFLPDQTKRKVPLNVSVNKDILNHYKNFIKIRKDNEALMLGDFKTLLTDNKNNIYAFSRNYESTDVIVIINNSEVPADITVPAEGQEYVDLLNGGIFTAVEGRLKINTDYKWGRILLKK